MATTLGRNLHMCFTKIKSPILPQSSHLQKKQQKNQSQLPPPSSNLIKNFNSLYATDCHDPKCIPSSPESATATPDFATVYASHRFFFSSPGHSNSIVEESTSSLASSSSSSLPEAESIAIAGGIAVPTLSPDPFMDFRRSMQEMVEARDLKDMKAKWEYLHELLTCYLSLNPKKTHKYIVRAFADLVVSLMAT